jgi:hypothetical protein
MTTWADRAARREDFELECSEKLQQLRRAEFENEADHARIAERIRWQEQQEIPNELNRDQAAALCNEFDAIPAPDKMRIFLLISHVYEQDTYPRIKSFCAGLSPLDPRWGPSMHMVTTAWEQAMQIVLEEEHADQTHDPSTLLYVDELEAAIRIEQALLDVEVSQPALLDLQAAQDETAFQRDEWLQRSADQHDDMLDHRATVGIE